MGFSESFASYLTSQNWQWVSDIKGKGIIGAIETDNAVSVSIKDPSWNYPEITKRINASKENAQKLSIAPKTSAEEKNYLKTRQYITSDLYSALEWVFSELYSVYPIPEWE